MVEAGGIEPPPGFGLLTVKVLDSPQNQALLVIFRKITAGPKRPKRTPIIPKPGPGPVDQKETQKSIISKIDTRLLQ